MSNSQQLPYGLITPQQLAEQIGMSPRTVYGWVRSGWITPTHVRLEGQRDRIGLHPSVIDQVRRPACAPTA